MVWNGAASTLYKAVERHNTAEGTPPHKPCPRSGNVHKTSAPSPLSWLTQDSDMLLILAVMLVLMHEKADMKLIMALAFVIFC